MVEFACTHNDSSFFHCIKLLLANGADIDAVNSSGATALLLAAIRGHIRIVEVCSQYNSLDSYPVFYQDKFKKLISLGGRIPLSFCSLSFPTKALLDSGANVDASNNSGSTSLMQASECGWGYIVKVTLVVKCFANSSSCSKHTLLLLCRATLLGNTSCCAILFQDTVSKWSRYRCGRL